MFVFGPLKYNFSSTSSDTNCISTLNDIGSDTSSTHHNVSFIPYWAGKGSYSFIKILGSVMLSVSNRVFTAIKVWLLPKFKSKSE